MNLTKPSSYGILEKSHNLNKVEGSVEEVRRLGFSVFDPGLSQRRIKDLSDEFDKLQARYIKLFGINYLKDRDEHNTIRLPLASSSLFLELASNKNLLEIIEKLIRGKFVLNQQNGIINPTGDRYNQDAWHRDLPYQHFISSRPLIVNALYCIDDFTYENGATYVLPTSHKEEAFPSEEYVNTHAAQITATAGSFIILDGMLYHRGSRNNTQHSRRAVNHVYTIPHIKQQISIPSAIECSDMDETTKDLLGYHYQIPSSVAEFIANRKPNK